MKKMHGRTLPVLSVGLIAGLLMCAGCLFGSPQQASPTNTTLVNDTGIVPITLGSSAQGTYSLEEAESAITSHIQVNGSTQNLPVYSILGENVDISGKADRWILGIREGKSTTLWVYDRSGLAPIAWSGDLPKQEIDTRGIIHPEKAIQTVYAENRNTTGYYNIEIREGEYIITESPSPAYMINATTGVLISTYD